MKRLSLFFITLLYLAEGFGQELAFTIPVPTITAAGSTTIITGSSVILNANPQSGFSYQWFRDRLAISGATTSSYKATISGDYTVSISLNSVSQVSPAAVTVNTIFDLPADNFQVSINDASCEGPANGAIGITAAQSFNYTATISGKGINASYPFTTSTQINNLAAGTYHISMTIAGQADFHRRFSVVIAEPKRVSAYTAVAPSGDQVVVSLDGGDTYKLVLNGVLYMTSDSQITLPLGKGINTITISTDKPCQGVLVKNVNVSPKILVYPNPFNSNINLSLGDDNLKTALISVISAEDGRPVYTNIYNNLAGIMQIDLSGVKNGLYLLRISGDNLEKVFKIQKR